MSGWNIPPRIKILEALSINAGNNIAWTSESSAKIDNVNVYFNKKDNSISFDEPKDDEKGYLSAQAMAVLIAKNILPNNRVIGENLASLEWNYKADEYSKAELKVKNILFNKGVSEKEIDAFLQFFTDSIRKNGFKVLEITKTQRSLTKFQ